MYKEDLHVCDSSQRLQSAVHFIHLTDKPQNCWVMLGCMIRESLTTMWIFSHSLSHCSPQCPFLLHPWDNVHLNVLLVKRVI